MMKFIVGQKQMNLRKLIVVACCAIEALSGNVLGVEVAQTQPENSRRTFADWCRQKADLNPETKYTVDVLGNDIGTPKNNYKHLIGSCRKITRAMASEELKKEWSLKLINAYSLYSVNTSSYISEANESLFSGFIAFYFSKECKQNYQIFEAKYKQYFDSLIITLDGNNTIFTNELELIMHSIMIEINMLHTSKMISNHTELLTLHK